MTFEDVDMDLSSDPEMAFVELEQHFRRILDEDAKHDEYGNPSAMGKLNYMSSVIAAAKVLKIPVLPYWVEQQNSYTVEFFELFVQETFHSVQIYKITRMRRNQENSATLNSPTKQKIRHFADRIKEVIDNLHIESWRKDVLYARLNAFVSELDRTRTRLDAFGSLVVDLAGYAGKAATKAKPAIDAITKLIGSARQAEFSDPLMITNQPRRLISGSPPNQPQPMQADSSEPEIPF